MLILFKFKIIYLIIFSLISFETQAKEKSYEWLGIDNSNPENQFSDRCITELFSNSVTLLIAGFTKEEVVDFVSSFLSDSPDKKGVIPDKLDTMKLFMYCSLEKIVKKVSREESDLLATKLIAKAVIRKDKELKKRAFKKKKEIQAKKALEKEKEDEKKYKKSNEYKENLKIQKQNTKLIYECAAKNTEGNMSDFLVALIMDSCENLIIGNKKLGKCVLQETKKNPSRSVIMVKYKNCQLKYKDS